VGAGVRPVAVQGKGAVGEVGEEADVLATRVRGRREERGRRGVGWASRPRRRGTGFFFLFLTQFSNASIN